MKKSLNLADLKDALTKPKLIEPTPEQLASGDYQRKFVTHAETQTKAMAHVSRHDPVMRWIAAGKLSESQQSAIGYVRRLWEIAGLKQRLTANYGQTRGAGSAERRAAVEIDARNDLHRCQGYFPGPMKAYFNVFENVCRHGMPAGVAGLEITSSKRTADARAHQIVCFVADIIATYERL